MLHKKIRPGAGKLIVANRTERLAAACMPLPVRASQGRFAGKYPRQALGIREPVLPAVVGSRAMMRAQMALARAATHCAFVTEIKRTLTHAGEAPEDRAARHGRRARTEVRESRSVTPGVGHERQHRQ